MLAAAVSSATARADPTLPGGATIAFGDLDTRGATVETYFNLAHCACSQPGAAQPGYTEGTFAYSLQLVGATAPVHRPLEIWVGSGCDLDATRATRCHQITSAAIADLSTIPPVGITPSVPTYDLMEPAAGELGCDSRAITGEEWAIADGNGDGIYDYFAGKPIATDALPPPLPTDYRAAGGNHAILLSWTPPADTSDIAGYQVLCALGENPASSLPPPAPRYKTARQLCGLGQDVPLRPAAIDTGIPADQPDADETVEIPQGIAELDPAFLCADTDDPDATQLRISGLPDRERLVVMLVAVDRAGNASAQYFYPTLSTRPHASGCCQAGGDPAGVAVIALALSLRACRSARRRRRSARPSSRSAASP